MPRSAEDPLHDASTNILGTINLLNLARRTGARFTLGYWLTPDRAWGVEATGFFLSTAVERRSVGTGQGRDMERPRLRRRGETVELVVH